MDLLDPVLSLLDRQVEALADQPTMPEFLIFGRAVPSRARGRAADRDPPRGST
jgi:hypothetical protein